MFLLQIDSERFLLDCVNCALHGSKNEVIACFFTVVVGFVIRAVEKRKIKKKLNSQNKEIDN